MNARRAEPSPFVRQGGEWPLSGPALAELLRAVLERGKPFRFCARGTSMSPSIRDGDRITVVPLAGGGPRPGDVVACLGGEAGGVVVHRVVGRRRDSCLIAGDRTPGEGDWVQRTNLLGRVSRVQRRGRDVRLGLGSERFLIALLRRDHRSWGVVRLLWRILCPLSRLPSERCQPHSAPENP